MKKNIFLSTIIIAFATALIAATTCAAVIIQSEAVQQASAQYKDELSNIINSSYAVSELPNGEHDGKFYGTLTYGSYIQVHGVETKTPIEWYILEKRNDTAILMSKYVLDSHAYDKAELYNTWNNTRIKKWLDTSFFNSAFTSYEANFIVSNPYRNTGRVFFLTENEAKYYFGGVKANLSIAAPTDKASKDNHTGSYKYWLEDELNYEGSPSISGSILNGIKYIAPDTKIGVRPCIIVRYTVDEALKAQVIPDTPMQAAQSTENIYNYSGISDYSSPGIVPTQETVQAYAPMYESNRTTVNYTYKTDSDDGDAKTFFIKTLLPVYTGGDPSQTAIMNTLMNTTALEIIKACVEDRIDERVNSIKKQLTVIPGPLTPLGSNVYSVKFEMNSSKICTIDFDLRSGKCYSED